MRLSRVPAIAAVVLLAAAPARAQDENLSRLIIDLLANGVISDRGVNLPGGPNPDHTSHFLISESAPLFFLNAGLFNQALAAQLSSFPLGSAAGGFTYDFDPETGTFARSSESFGPAIVERAVTQGRSKFSFGVNYQRSTYDSFEGRSLGDGEIRFYLEHNDCCPPPARDTTDPTKNPFFEGDLVESALSLDLTTDTTLIFMNYGLTNRLDVGVVVPILRVDLQATNAATIIRLATAEFPQIHRFDGANADRRDFVASGSKSGIGDIAVRAKWNFARNESGGLALGLEARLPTGDEDNLLGAGAAQGKASLIGSATFGTVSAHANVGYRLTGEGLDQQLTVAEGRTIDLNDAGVPFELNPDEVSYAAGLEAAVTPRFTISGGVFGRMLIDAGRLEERTNTYRFRLRTDPPPPAAPARSVSFGEFGLREGNLHQVLGAVSLKINLGRTFLLSGTGLFALNDAGLKDKFTPIVGIDYTF